MNKFLSGIVAALFVLAANPGPAAAQPEIADFGEKIVTANGEDVSAAGATVIVNGQAASVRAAGASVAIHADVTGNADAAGAEVTVDGDVGRARLAGGSVTLTGNVAGDAYVAGGVVTVTSRVGGAIHVGGGQVSIGPQAVATGIIRIGGGTITFDGRAEGGARLTGGSVRVNGNVTGNLVVEGGRIIIGPTAVVSGDVVVRSLNEPTVDPNANIAGTVRLEAPSTWWDQAMFESWPFRFAVALFVAASTFVTGIVLMLLGRGTFEDATTLARMKVVSSFLIGLISLILLPIVAIALMVTVAGIPAGLALLFAIPILIVVSYAVAATGLADLVFNRPRAPRAAARTVIFLIVGSIFLGLISLIPVAGPVIILVLLIVGAGAFLRSARRRARRWRRASPVEPGKSPVAA